MRPTTAYVVESRRGIEADAGSCSTGALVYRVDASVRTGQGPVVRVMDAKPAAATAGGCRPLDDAPFRADESFTDVAAGVRIDVLAADGYGGRPYASRSRRRGTDAAASPAPCQGAGSNARGGSGAALRRVLEPDRGVVELAAEGRVAEGAGDVGAE